ncbi:relaxase/mobilization nuclease domain-containing protein, partial [Aeromonas hydrophila]|nr:relaxase/mobilization nuclease domain-containing protein [Aeromonas hydrophila]
MAVIRFFATNGHRQTKSSAPIDYLLGIYSALTPQQKNERSTIADAIRVARDKNDAPLVHRLNQQLRLIHGVQRTPPPELLAGNPRDITYAIEISPHKYKYTSGVIAHAIEDNQALSSNPDIAQEFRALMEELVFAGLPIEDRMILWVQHTHEQNLENHFLIPRINLRTGKYFNPHPPGAEGDFNAIRDYLNLKHNLARPDDPQRQRLTGTIPRYSKNADLIAALSDAVQLRVTQGQLCNRQAVIDWLEQPQTRQMYGISEVEAKKDYIRIVPEGKIKAFRLKGPLFSRAFTSIDAVRPTLTITTPPQPSLDALWQQIEERIAKRRAFNQSRYNVTETLHPMPSPRPVRRPTGMTAVIIRGDRKQPTNALFWQQQMQLYAGYTLTPVNPEGTLTVDTERALIQLLMKIVSAILAL